MTKQERAKKLAEAIELTLDSLSSHLGYVNDVVKNCNVPSHRAELGDKAFHRQCVREYAFVVLVLSEELERL